MSERTWAVLADIHGNSWALDAVLADVRRRGVAGILNLGDCLYGPLDPEGTAERLLPLNAPTVRGNQDRNLVSPPPAMRTQPTFRFMDERLTGEHRSWLASFPRTLRVEDILLCHGTPDSDEELLLEDVRETGVFLMPLEKLQARVEPLGAAIVLCAHSHVPRTAWAGRTGVINPGSVGLPAYTADQPLPHAMESGSPHARYVLLTRDAGSWRVEHVAVPYDWSAAAEAARRNGRPDWAEWIATGRARRP